jgi:cytochrome P450
VTHRLERHWPDAGRFDPDRWKARPGPPQATAKDQYLPFGSGARACLASHLAFPLVTTIVREVVSAAALSAEGGEPGIRYWGTAYPREPLRVRAAPAPLAPPAAWAS